MFHDDEEMTWFSLTLMFPSLISQNFKGFGRIINYIIKQLFIFSGRPVQLKFGRPHTGNRHIINCGLTIFRYKSPSVFRVPKSCCINLSTDCNNGGSVTQLINKGNIWSTGKECLTSWQLNVQTLIKVWKWQKWWKCSYKLL